MRALENLIDMLETLLWIEKTAGEGSPHMAAESLSRIRQRVQEQIAEIDLFECAQCKKPYLRSPGSRHYRCSTCRWRRHQAKRKGVAKDAAE